KPATAEHANHFLQSFCDHADGGKQVSTLKVRDLKPLHVTKWLRGKTWNDTTKNRAISVVSRAFNYCVEQGVLKANPIKGMKKPRMKRREKIITEAERA